MNKSTYIVERICFVGLVYGKTGVYTVRPGMQSANQVSNEMRGESVAQMLNGDLRIITPTADQYDGQFLVLQLLAKPLKIAVVEDLYQWHIHSLGQLANLEFCSWPHIDKQMWLSLDLLLVVLHGQTLIRRQK